MSFFNLFRKKISKFDFLSACLASHKDISRALFHQFKIIFHYKDEFDMLLAFQEIEYLVFWLLRRKLNEAILIDMYKEFLNKSKMTDDAFREQLELRYKIYDNAYDRFVSEPQKDNNPKHGLAIGQILIKSIGDLNLLKNGILKDPNSTSKCNDENISTVFKAFVIWAEGIKLVDNIIETSKRSYQVDSFLR